MAVLLSRRVLGWDLSKGFGFINYISEMLISITLRFAESNVAESKSSFYSQSVLDQSTCCRGGQH